MDVGDTFRIGGIPIVLVGVTDGESHCSPCIFDGRCTVSPWCHGVTDVERRIGTNCVNLGFRYEVRQ